MTNRRPNCRCINHKNWNITDIYSNEKNSFEDLVRRFRQFSGYSLLLLMGDTVVMTHLDIHRWRVGLCTKKKGYDSHTGGEQHGQKHSQTPFKLKVSTLISVVVSFQGHLLEHRAKTTEKYVTVPVLTSCAVQKYRPSNNRGIESASLCQCLKKNKIAHRELHKAGIWQSFHLETTCIQGQCTNTQTLYWE